MSKKLYAVRMGVMRVYDIVRRTQKGWYVTTPKSGDLYIARNNKEVRAAANRSDLSYFEYNHVTVNRGEAKAVCEQQLHRYARYQRIDMMNKLGRPIVDVVEITRIIDNNGGSSASVYHNGSNGICITAYDGENNLKHGFEVTYKGDAVKFEAELEHSLEQLIGKLKNG
ncbi:hypothetical protein B8b_04 [Pseudoalteromonas phage B8b]|uniref:Uncharacterized protein n=1 Tax=Pseudoalteromonas phage B8b TaxID=1506997 RepID=A0A076G645_9CAUD|nr:hypothetical protein B8b_04 [Pseudoalteromonas phage B8b]|tara:strand:+ start:2827 stop:3333 length:507 start_codon:yes stop_codon:yes gene_type:complete